MKSPKYSILIPVYNRKNLIAQTLDCAFSQDYPNIEVIVVDNCSTDGTWDEILKYKKLCPGLLAFRNQVNVGPVLNWEMCLKYATGEYGKFLYSDDLISTNFVSETVALFDDKTAFVIGSCSIFKSLNQEIRLTRYPEVISSSKYIKDVILYNLYGYPVSPTSASFRISDLKLGLIINIPNSLNLDYKHFGAGNDLLIFLTIASKYRVIKSAASAIAYFRHHPGSITVSNSLTAYYHHAIIYFIKDNYLGLWLDWQTLWAIRQLFCKSLIKELGIDYKICSVAFLSKLLWFRGRRLIRNGLRGLSRPQRVNGLEGTLKRSAEVFAVN